MFKSLRHKLLFFYLALHIFSILVIGTSTIYTLQIYYDKNLHAILKNQVENISNFYNNYLSGNDLNTNAPKLLEMYSNTPYPVEFIHENGKILSYKLFFQYDEKTNTPAFENARNNILAPYIFHDAQSNTDILSYVAPLKNSNTVEGFVRIQTSLTLAQQSMRNMTWMVIIFGIALILINALLGLAVANSIIRPIEALEKTSQAIAKGDFSQHVTITTKDEIGRLTQSMNHMTQELSKAEKLKNRFISTVSHELRTPLTAIKGWALTLLHSDAAKSEEAAEGLGIIATEADRLTELVNELLDFSKIQSGQLLMQFERIELNALATSVYMQMKVKTQPLGIGFSFSPAAQELYLNLDKQRLRQVLINLIDNAIKSIGKEGEILLTLSQDLTKNTAILTLSDNGRGIHPEDLPHIKKTFYQGKEATQRHGLGLGLALCDDIIRRHHGSLEIQSDYGTGTTVTLTLPLYALTEA